MRKWGQPYLNRQFFSLIGQTMSDKILLIMVKNNNKYIAGALNFLGGETIYGRNWGCIEDHRYLHFEVCYYRAIDFAIQKKLKKLRQELKDHTNYHVDIDHQKHILHIGLRILIFLKRSQITYKMKNCTFKKISIG